MISEVQYTYNMSDNESEDDKVPRDSEEEEDIELGQFFISTFLQMHF